MKSVRVLFVIALLFTIPFAAHAADALRLVPADAVAVGMMRISELRSNPLAGKIFNHCDRAVVGGEAERFLRQAGFDPMKDIDTVVFSLAPAEGELQEPNVLLMMEGRFDVDRLQQSIEKRGAVRVLTDGVAYYRFPEHDADSDHGALAWLSPGVAVAGKERAVIQAIADDARGDTGFRTAGGLAHMLGRIDSTSSAWMLVDLPRAARLKGETTFPDSSDKNAAMRQALRNVSAAGLWADTRADQVTLGGTAICNDDETLQLIEDLLRGMLAGWRLAAQEKVPEMVSAIRRFQVERSDGAITLKGEIPADIFERFAKHKAQRLAK